MEGFRATASSGLRGSRFEDDIFARLRGGVPAEGSRVPRKAAPVKRKLHCNLENLYTGFTKKMKISRNVTDHSGRSTIMDETLTIEVKPGQEKGTKFLFPERGNEQPGVIPADLVLIIDEHPHSVFKREGNDLVITQKISLLEALTGYTAQITTLDDRNLTIPINSVISPVYEEVVEGEGMPIPKEPSKKGNLRIKFHIEFPNQLTLEQKTDLKQVLTFA